MIVLCRPMVTWSKGHDSRLEIRTSPVWRGMVQTKSWLYFSTMVKQSLKLVTLFQLTFRRFFNQKLLWLLKQKFYSFFAMICKKLIKIQKLRQLSQSRNAKKINAIIFLVANSFFHFVEGHLNSYPRWQVAQFATK